VEDQPDKKAPTSGFLSQLGISSDFVQKVRFRGPVGKLALIGLACIVAVGGVGLRSSDTTVQLVSISLAAAVVLLIARAILWYSTKFPEQATLEGMEVVVMQRQKAWAAKGMSGIPDSLLIPNPNGAPPKLDPSEGLEL